MRFYAVSPEVGRTAEHVDTILGVKITRISEKTSSVMQGLGVQARKSDY
jgi:hypothetical protein